MRQFGGYKFANTVEENTPFPDRVFKVRFSTLFFALFILLATNSFIDFSNLYIYIQLTESRSDELSGTISTPGWNRPNHINFSIFSATLNDS